LASLLFLLIKAMMSDWKSCFRSSFVPVFKALPNCQIFIWMCSHSLKRLSCALRSSSLSLRSSSLSFKLPLVLYIGLPRGAPCFCSPLYLLGSSSRSLQSSSLVFLAGDLLGCHRVCNLTLLLSPLHFVNVLLVEDSLEDGLPVL